MSSSVDLSTYPSCNEILPIEEFDEDDNPASHPSFALHSISLSAPDDNSNDIEINNNSSSSENNTTSCSSKKKQQQQNNNGNDCSSNKNNNNNGSSNSELEAHVSELIKAQSDNDMPRVVEETPEGVFQAKLDQSKLRKLKQIITKWKLQVLSAPIISSASSDTRGYTRSNTLATSNTHNALDGLPNLHMSELFRHSSAFKDIRATYDCLDRITKLCLLCFAVFPENAVVKKRLLIYWWVGEGLLVLPSSSERPGAVEDIAEGIFEELMVKGFIEPVNKGRLVPDSFKMHPFIRSAVIMLAQEAGFFDFDSKGTPTANFLSCHRACLVKSERGSRLQVPHSNQVHLHTLFNVSEPYLDFDLEWFSKLKNVNVLSLGRWQSSAKHHIEVEDAEFLKGLKYMKYLKFLSLNGISRITELPDSICNLTHLKILDLKACHNLEALPDRIGLLKNLTHFDMSECYLLNHMPKGLASLLQLQVLKGFVIVDPKSTSICTLENLQILTKLRKLSVSTDKMSFPTDKDLICFQQFKSLRKLTIAWTGVPIQTKPDNSTKQENLGAVKSMESGTTNPDNGADDTKQDTGETEQSTLTIAWGGVSLQAKPDNRAKQDNVAVKSMETGTTNLDNRGDMSKQDIGAAEPAATLPAAKKAVIRKTLSRLGTIKLHKVTDSQTLPTELEKLDLQCFPQRTTPNWLMPGTLKNLKKLYIRGGKLRGLGQVQEAKDRWAVEILRLKFLCELKMDWRELRVLFPKLIYLEKVRCPNLIFFPCDESGVWLNENSGTI